MTFPDSFYIPIDKQAIAKKLNLIRSDSNEESMSKSCDRLLAARAEKLKGWQLQPDCLPPALTLLQGHYPMIHAFIRIYQI